MNIKRSMLTVLTLFLFTWFLSACGAPDNDRMEVSGSIDQSSVAGHIDAPILVMVVRTDDLEKLEDNPEDVIVSLISVDKNDLSFNFDLTDKDIPEGESLSVIAFVDTANNGETPYPKTGDYLGIYMQQDSLAAGVKVQSGDNSGIELSINRAVYDFDAEIRGTVNVPTAGTLTLITYAGDFRSSGFNDLNLNDVIGYTRIKNVRPGQVTYKMPVMPYGKNLPIEGAFIFAVLDANKNDKVDEGDRIGYYTTRGDELPEALTIEGDLNDMDIAFHMDAVTPSGYPITMSGTITPPAGYAESGKPVFILVTESDNIEEVLNKPVSAVKYFEKLVPGATTFNLDLADTDIRPGDEVTIVALLDNNFTYGFPNPDTGDMIGFHMPEDALSPAYEIRNGSNPNIDITINRPVFDYKAHISGQVMGPETGDLTLVAYTGSFNSSDPSDIDPDRVMGYMTLDKNSDASLDYTMRIMPYGQDLPLENVFVMAVLDVNRNGDIDGGDKVGYYTISDNELPTPLTVDGDVSGIDVRFTMDVDTPSGFPMALMGTANMPAGYAQSDAPLFIIVAEGDEAETLMDRPVTAIKYFERIPKGRSDFKLDLSKTSLKPGDDIMVMALWDKNFTAGFPHPDKGDMIGFYLDSDKLTASYTLENESNSGIAIDVNREIFDFKTNVRGSITGDGQGPVTLVAYNGPIRSSDFSDLDMEKIIGYKKVDKRSDTIGYSMRLLPYGQDRPLNDVFIFALLDLNDNGTIDGGDRLGYYTVSEDDLPTPINIAADVDNIDVGFYMTVDTPSGYDMSLSGNAVMPPEYDETSPPVFVIVAKGNALDKMMTDPVTSIKYFRKLDPGETTFDLDLSKTDISPGDELMVITLWDRDYTCGFPNPNRGDIIGYYLATGQLKATYSAKAGSNPNLEVNVNREIYDFDAHIEGTVRGDETGDLTLILYYGDMQSSDFNSLDLNKISGFFTGEKEAEDLPYRMTVIPYGQDLPIENAYIYALLDVNKNGRIDGGDRIGYHTTRENELPTPFTVDGNMENLDIRFFMTVSDPSGYDTALSGNLLELPENYGLGSPPVFMIVASGDDVTQLTTSPATAIKYFEKLPPGATSFHLDLSGTDIVPSDEIMLIALWDRNFVSGFPDPDTGDMIGLYMDMGRYAPTLEVPPASDTFITMTADVAVNREIFDYDATIQGTIQGDDAGDVIVIAYAGEITSSDFSAIDPKDVIGFTRLDKPEGAVPYSLEILPYGKNVPVEDVYIIGLIDKNRNGTLDADDVIAYHTTSENGLPTGITIPAANHPVTIPHINLSPRMTVEAPSGYTVKISGSIDIPQGHHTDDQPAYIIVAKSDDVNALLDNPASAIKFFQKIPSGQSTFDLDLSGTSLKPDDDIIILGLWDTTYHGFPSPDPGDYVGFYANRDKLTVAYTLKDDQNSGIDIVINRRVTDVDATISGQINGSIPGDLTLIAYTGPITSSNFQTIDIDHVQGFFQAEKGGGSMAYRMRILPYGSELPMENVLMLAVLDVNKNGEIDGGDKIGYYSNDDNGFPTPLTITGSMSGIDIDFHMDVPYPSGYDMTLEGDLVMPSAYGQTNNQPVFIIVAHGGNFDTLVDDPLSAIKTFTKVPQGSRTFSVDLSATDLVPGDDIMIVALWDKNYNGGFPNPDTGDMIGLYMNTAGLSPTYSLHDGRNTGIHITVDRNVFDFDASVSGKLRTTGTGDVTVIAYNGDINSSGLSTLDFKNVIGYGRYSKETATPLSYGIQILPYGYNIPIENTYIFALLDVDRNGDINGGDKIGYFKDPATGLPADITIWGNHTGIDIDFEMNVPEPSGYQMSVSGNLTLPTAYYNSDTPLFIIVARAESLPQLMTNPASAITYFERVPHGASSYAVDLSRTDLVPGEDILIVALWDKNFQGGFPNPDTGDILGIYVDTDNMTPSHTLHDGSNTGLDIDVNREIFDYDAHVSGVIRGQDTGDLTLVAYTGEFTSSDVDGIDVSKIIGYGKFDKASEADMPYTLDILPYGQNVPIDNVYIVGVLDTDRNGIMDGGDRIGFHTYPETGLPQPIVVNGDLTGVDVTFGMTLDTPSGLDVSLSGSIDIDSAYGAGGQPLYIIVASGDGLQNIQSDPLSAVKYFAKLPSGISDFTIDLSRTSLKPGDEILLLGLWDRNYNGAYPNPDAGDMVGIYLDIDQRNLSPTYTIREEDNTGLRFAVDREIFDFQADVAGQFQTTDTGDITVVAYNGDIKSSNMTALDFSHVVGYGGFHKEDADPLNYAVQILPYGYDIPIESTYMFALLDMDMNGEVNGGDKIGYFKDADTDLPRSLTISGHHTGIDIDFMMNVPEPSGFDVSISGALSFPEAYYNGTTPAYIIVARADNLFDLMESPVSAISYFEQLPQGATGYHIDLSQTDLAPGEDIMIIALWDRNFTGGFPYPDVGDVVGIYVDMDNLAPSHTLIEGANTGLDINVTRKIFDFDADISGTVNVNNTGDLILVAYTGEFNTNDLLGMDPDKILGYAKIDKNTQGPIAYTMAILPYGRDLPMDDVYVYAVLDENKNGKIDAGDRVGYYTRSILGLPTTVTLPDNRPDPTHVTGIDIDIKRVVIDHDTTISFQIDPADRPANLVDGTNLIALVVHEDGLLPVVNIPINSDYVIGMHSLPFVSDPNHVYRFDLLDFIYEGIDFSQGMNVAVYVFYDRDGSGLPSVDDSIAAYWKGFCIRFPFNFCVEQPMLWSLSTNVDNFLVNANNDPGNDPYGVKFINANYQILLRGLAASSSPEIEEYRLSGEAPSEPSTILNLLGVDINDLEAQEGDAGSPGVDVEIGTDNPAPGDYSFSLTGSVTLPELPEGLDLPESPVFILLLDLYNLDELFSDFSQITRYVEMIPQGTQNFHIDLADTGLEPGDAVAILALWDRNFDGIAPSLDMEDLLGFYTTGMDIFSTYILEETGMEDISIQIDTDYLDLEASVQ